MINKGGGIQKGVWIMNTRRFHKGNGEEYRTSDTVDQRDITTGVPAADGGKAYENT